MGKGDQRSRRGKIHRGTFGKRRPKRRKGLIRGPAAPAGARAGKKAEKE